MLFHPPSIIAEPGINTDGSSRPSKFVLSADGKATQLKIWAETFDVLRTEAQGADLGTL